MIIHYIKCVQPFFEMVWNGDKPFEIRENDRAYQANHNVVQSEYNPQFPDAAAWTGRQVYCLITCVIPLPPFTLSYAGKCIEYKDPVLLGIKILDKGVYRWREND